ncbi:MAG: hypothetical protein RAO94_04825 [Candidatus Stygibacter australis]|nr:hypothetical protein [Candidatus Stygibacter australis]
MKRLMCFSILILFLSILNAQDAKIDSLLKISKETEKQINELYNQYRNDPLADKTWGVEFNLIRFIACNDETTTLSGGFSYFGKPMMEIYFPWYYYKHHNEDYYFYDDDDIETGIDKLFYADARIRLFTGNTSNGFFMSGLTRFALLESRNIWDNLHHSTTKWGIGFGIGWRSFSYRGFNWGFSLSMGRYFTGEEGILNQGTTSMFFLEEATNDSEIFYDLEFLKFGFAF